MPTHFFKYIFIVFCISVSANAANLSAVFELLDKNNQILNTFSFEGEYKKSLRAEVKTTSTETASVSGSALPLKCEATGVFDEIIVHHKKMLQTNLVIECGQNEQKTKSKIGRILISLDDYKSFQKMIFIHSSHPQVFLKIKAISL